jgi:uncharacterized protein YdeI (YjbR/CyaY-like superfamily)
MGDEPEQVELTSVDDLRAWLAEHHADRTSAMLVRWKKNKGPHVPWAEMVRELLCWGWIDSTARPVDDARSAQLVTPRRPTSGWSRVNKQHVVELLADGRMQPAGQAAIDRARQNGSWVALDEVEDLVARGAEPDDLGAALDAVPLARVRWDALSRSARRVVLVSVLTAKRAETRATRVQKAVDRLADR